ncbi:YhgE/Pip domain-containing protein [Methanobacterium petrolearium]|uniref:YhgE/Pip domain-containing protein n=1 Tax=Methanobacterium petrolearium TaxID=710190 RepID=UPI001AE330FD|nr:YhgE/Pip domain-containing protein [Methanobacterium petrolearium]MBP1946734.1 putative membrane protein [Methanobacterium petrolearium]BDZ70981.1 phage infection protein [Methanobacterium petrolearium]
MIKGAREIFKNDIKTVIHSPVVSFVLLAIIIIPSLYALLNIQATWDPYTLTSNIKVAVVDGDSGYTYNGTPYNIGDSLVEELKNNDKFSWQFVDEKTAREGVKKGDYYAALIIPANFSQQIFSVDTSNPQSAQIEYLVNDKLNAIVPRMTNVGADTIQAQINDEIVKTIDGIIFGKLSDVGEQIKENKAQILKTKYMVNQLNGKLSDIDATLEKGNSVMSTVDNIWPTFSAELPEIQTEANYVKEKYDTLYTYIKENPTKALNTVQNMEIATNTIVKSLKYLDAILTTLYDVTGDTNLKPIIDQIELDITKANKVLGILQEIETDLKAGNDPSSKLNQLKSSIDQMDSAINTLANNRENINQIIKEASAKLTLANSKWPEFRNAISTASNKLNGIDEADLDRIIAFSDVDQSGVKNYFESPVVLNKKHVYPVDNYGSALSPFYISLSLWIGCIIAVAMLTMRVKTEKKYSAETVYLGRMGLFLIMSIFQALVVAVGAIMLKVQLSSVLLFVVTTVYVGLCFMIVVYSLTSAFGNAGKAMAIIILVFQITATGGIFPVEILPSFFQAIHAYLPLTYAIGALREVVAGVYWSNFWYCMGSLALFPVLAFGLTLLIKEKMDKPAQWAENKLKESGLF